MIPDRGSMTLTACATELLPISVHIFFDLLNVLSESIINGQLTDPTNDQIRAAITSARTANGTSASITMAVRHALARRQSSDSIGSASGGAWFPGELGPWHDLGRAAERRSDWSEAEWCWRCILEISENVVWAHTSLAIALREQGRTEEAAAHLLECIGRFPREVGPWAELATLASRRGDWWEAERCWRGVLAISDDIVWVQTALGIALREQGRTEEAVAHFTDCIVRFPKEIGPWAELGTIAARRGNWTESEHCWRTVISMDANIWWSYNELFKSLEKQDKNSTAMTIILGAVERFPREYPLVEEAVRFATVIGELRTACDLARSASTLYPGEASMHLSYIRLLRQLGHLIDASSHCSKTVNAFPDNPEVHIECARVAFEQGKFSEAAHLWEIAETRFPLNRQIANNAHDARLALAGHDVRPASHSVSEHGRSSAKTPRELLLNFESLGGHWFGCEFGQVQREYHAEPLGLLRWSGTYPDRLAQMFEAELDGVGLPENTTIEPNGHGHGDYTVGDHRFFGHSHTFIPSSTDITSELKESIYKRFRFLKEKLLFDLRSCEKIFVYKYTDRRLTEQEIRPLLISLRRYGDNFLLYVTKEEEGKPNGLVEMTERGLMIGYISHFIVAPDGEKLDLPCEEWLQLCRNAYDVWTAGR